MPLVHGIETARVEAVVFDLGGVFLAGGVEAVAGFGARHGLPEEAWTAIRRDLFHEQGLWAAVERGRAPFAEFVARLRALVAEHGIEVAVGDAADFMQNAGAKIADRLRVEIVEVAKRLRARMPTALLTNNIPEWRDAWRTLLDVERLFDVVVDSSEVGTRKPEPEIYEITRAKLGLPHEALLFVDDLGVNLKTARSLGWQTLRYDDTARVLEVLDTIVNARDASRRAMATSAFPALTSDSSTS
jgi:epoxide hydrolase-like predicted phosphatase